MKTTFGTHTTRIIAICMMLIMLIATPGFAMAGGLSAGSTAYVCADTFVNMRLEPQGEIIGKIARGETVTILSGPDRNSYYHVKVNKTGQTCYVYGVFLTADKVEKNVRTKTQNKVNKKEIECPICEECLENCNEHIYYVTSKHWLNLREGPSMDTKRIMKLYHGVILIVLDDEPIDKFVKVIVLDDGTEGYVHTDYISKEPPSDVTYTHKTCVYHAEYQGYDQYQKPITIK